MHPPVAVRPADAVPVPPTPEPLPDAADGLFAPWIDAPVYPHHADRLPPGTIEAGDYRLRFAWTWADLDAAQALRHRVFTEEPGEGDDDAAASGRDRDARDPWFHHLLIEHQPTRRAVGTYRLQTAVMAATRFGFYSATLFELGAVPAAILDQAVEVGRACVAPEHRNGRVLRLLWRGLARYLQWNGKRFLFGCCSIPGTDPATAQAAWRIVHARRVLHDRFVVRPRPDARVIGNDRARPLIDAEALAAPLPPLFEGYLALGAKVCGPPAVDHDFGTTDFLVLLDVEDLDPRTRRSFFG